MSADWTEALLELEAGEDISELVDVVRFVRAGSESCPLPEDYFRQPLWYGLARKALERVLPILSEAAYARDESADGAVIYG